MGKRKNWSEQELIVAFNLYCKLPFGQYNHANKKVIELAEVLGRTPDAIAFKLGNFARLDPVHQKRGVKGWQHGSKLDEVVWNKFNQNWEKLAYQSEIALAQLKKQKHHEIIPPEEGLPKGKDREAIVKVRVNQNFFRQMILANYRNRCSVCSLPIEGLLVAGHIIPWSKNVALRMNPRNGICMCVLHEKAFDKGFIAISDDYKILLSKTIKKIFNEPFVKRGFGSYESKKIRLPDKFIPEKEFFESHRKNTFDQ